MSQYTEIKLTDKPSIRIVEHYQKQCEDKQAGRTLTRLIQAAHAAGLRLTPDAVADVAPQPSSRLQQTA